MITVEREREFLSKYHLGFFKAKVMDVIPVSVDDDGNSREQDCVIQLDNGQILSLHDNDFQCEKEDIGQIKRIQILDTFRASIEICKESRRKGIIPYPLDQGDIADICGVIEKIIIPPDEKSREFWRYAILDVGIGKMVIILWKDHKEDFTQFHEGDHVMIKGGGLDLLLGE